MPSSQPDHTSKTCSGPFSIASSTGVICTFPYALVTASWLVLLARYGGSDSVDVIQHEDREEDTETVTEVSTIHAAREFYTAPDAALSSVWQQAKALGGRAISTQGGISTFPLAENRGISLSGEDSFQTAIIRYSVNSFSSETLHHSFLHEKYAIILTLEDNRLVIRVDKRISSPAHDPDLPVRLLAQLELVCIQMEQAPMGTTVADLNFMTEVDKIDLALMDGPMPPAIADVVHNLVGRAVNKWPQADALCSWEGTMTYRELDNITSAFAARLRNLGIRRGVAVPIFFEKSMWQPVAMIAVSKAGGTWVTLPYDMPHGRMQSIVEQLDCTLGISSGTMEGVASELVTSVLLLDKKLVAELAIDIKLKGNENAEETQTHHPVEPDDVAYIIFTSGTTGNPKGIQVTHQNISTVMAMSVKSLGVPGVIGMRRSQMLSYAFDMSLMESLTALCNGGCLCILSEHERLNDISGAISRMAVTDMDMTPSLADSLDPEEFPTVKRIHLAGEPLTKSVADKWQPFVEVFTSYGPAECTILSHALSTRHTLWNSSCVGRPVSSRAFITDPNDPHRRLPRGFVGEILIEGPIVSQGYVKNAKQTAEAFINSLSWVPHDAKGKARMFYRSGDLGFVDSNGLYWVKGRRDLQVKIRGQRLELTEVESILQAYMSKSERAVADIIELRDSTKVLVAFLQMDTDRDTIASDYTQTLRAKISERLPPAFIPSAFLIVDHIPLSPTGKTDRKKLKAMVGNVSMAELLRIKHIGDFIVATEDAASLTTRISSNAIEGEIQTTQRELAMIWSCVFGLEAHHRLDQDAHFLTMGGDSLRALKVVSLARKKNMNLTVRTIFQNPTLGAMAAAAVLHRLKPVGNTSMQDNAAQIVIPDGMSEQEYLELKEEAATDLGVDIRSVEDIYPATRIQESLWTLSKADNGAYVLQYSFDLPPNADLCRLRDAWLRVIDRNAILRTRFFQASDMLWQVVLFHEPHYWQELGVMDTSEVRSSLRQQLSW